MMLARKCFTNKGKISNLSFVKMNCLFPNAVGSLGQNMFQSLCVFIQVSVQLNALHVMISHKFNNIYSGNTKTDKKCCAFTYFFLFCFKSGGKRIEKNWQEMSLKWVNVGRNILLFDVLIIESSKLEETLQSHPVTPLAQIRINSEFKLHCSGFCPVRS